MDKNKNEIYDSKVCPKILQSVLDQVPNIVIPLSLLDKDHYLTALKFSC